MVTVSDGATLFLDPIASVVQLLLLFLASLYCLRVRYHRLVQRLCGMATFVDTSKRSCHEMVRGYVSLAPLACSGRGC